MSTTKKHAIFFQFNFFFLWRGCLRKEMRNKKKLYHYNPLRNVLHDYLREVCWIILQYKFFLLAVYHKWCDCWKRYVEYFFFFRLCKKQYRVFIYKGLIFLGFFFGQCQIVLCYCRFYVFYGGKFSRYECWKHCYFLLVFVFLFNNFDWKRVRVSLLFSFMLNE